MTSQANSPNTFLAGEAMAAPFLRVRLGAARTVYLAGAADYGIGAIQEAVASGARVAVRNDFQGSSKMVASGAITAGQRVYAAAGGKVASSGSLLIGTAIDAATGNNSVIEVLPTMGNSQWSSSSSSSSSSST